MFKTVIFGGPSTPLQKLRAGLRADGVYQGLDRLWIFAQPTAAQARIDLIAGASATINNAPTFTANRGYTGDGLAAYVDTNFNPSTAGGHYTQNSASYGLWVYNDPGGAIGEPMGNDDNNWTIIQFRAAGAIQAGINQTLSPPLWTPAARTGLTALDRTGASAMAAYNNGVSSATGSGASTAPVSRNFTVLGANSSSGVVNFSTAGVSAAFLGGALGSAGQAALYNRLRTYMTAVGVP